jgi:hypothetical protein
MRNPEYPDCFVVVNGPEDGTEFPIVRAPFHIGRDVSCAVNLRLDDSVRDFHVSVSAVSDGYRVRRNDDGPVFVDGKRAGMFRSKIIRSAGQLKVGETLLCLECAPEGLASRSHGLVTQSDLGWAVTQTVRGAFHLARNFLRFAIRIFGRLLSSWLALAAMVFLVYLAWPAFRYYVNWALYAVYYKVWALFTGAQ